MVVLSIISFTMFIQGCTIKHLNITLRHLRTFIVVAQEGSFNRAADTLARTQPAITLAIKQLEEFIGLKLLERTTRRVVPTVEGNNFIPVAERLVRDFDTAIHDLRATAERRSGHVSIATLPSVANSVLPDIITRFNQDYPGICLHLYDDNSQGVQQRIERNEVDFGIGSFWQPNQELTFMPILRDTFELVCHRDHPLAKDNTPIEWQSLAQEKFLDTGISYSLPVRKYIGAPKLDFHTITTLLAMLRCNIGVTSLPSLAIPRSSDELVSRPLIGPIETRDICLITRKQATLSPAAEAMLETLDARIPSLAKELGLMTLYNSTILADFKKSQTR